VRSKRAAARFVASEPRVDRGVGAELAESPDPGGRGRVLEQRRELVAEARRGQVADEAHLDAAPEETGRVVLEAEAVPRLVPNAPEDPRGVVDEREVVEDAERAGVEVGAPAVRVDEPAEVDRGE
jgi:hypothetical protein